MRRPLWAGDGAANSVFKVRGFARSGARVTLTLLPRWHGLETVHEGAIITVCCGGQDNEHETDVQIAHVWVGPPAAMLVCLRGVNSRIYSPANSGELATTDLEGWLRSCVERH